MQSLLTALDGQCLEKYCVVTMAQWISGDCHYWPFIATCGNVGFSGQISAEQILPTG